MVPDNDRAVLWTLIVTRLELNFGAAEPKARYSKVPRNVVQAQASFADFDPGLHRVCGLEGGRTQGEVHVRGCEGGHEPEPDWDVDLIVGSYCATNNNECVNNKKPESACVNSSVEKIRCSCQTSWTKRHTCARALTRTRL